MGGVRAVPVTATLAAVWFRCVFAVVHVVGGPPACLLSTWSPNGLCDYEFWALQRDFVFGDFLVFNFVAGESTVAQVSQQDYASCNIGTGYSLPSTTTVYRVPPQTFNLTVTGTFYIVSTIDILCTQKFSLTVSNPPPTATPNAPANPTPTATPNTPPKKSGINRDAVVEAVTISVAAFIIKLVIIGFCIRRCRNNNKPEVENQVNVGPHFEVHPGL